MLSGQSVKVFNLEWALVCQWEMLWGLEAQWRVTVPQFAVSLGYLEENCNFSYVVPLFHHCFFLLVCRNELSGLKPCLFLCLLGLTILGIQVVSDINQGSFWSRFLHRGEGSKAPFEGHFLVEVLWNSKELKWWKVALVHERKQMMIVSSDLWIFQLVPWLAIAIRCID